MSDGKSTVCSSASRTACECKRCCEYPLTSDIIFSELSPEGLQASSAWPLRILFIKRAFLCFKKLKPPAIPTVYASNVHFSLYQARLVAMIGLYTTLAWLCPEALAQASIQLSPSDSNNTFSLTVTELPATGVAVIWRSTNLLQRVSTGRRCTRFPPKNKRNPIFPSVPAKRIRHSSSYRGKISTCQRT